MDCPVTLITGTRKGIGKSLASHFVAAGHRVVGCSREPIDWDLPGYEHFVTDVADEPGVKRMFSSVRKHYQRLDHLINNAGIGSMNHSILTPLSTVQRILNTNFVGTFLCCREAAKLMQKRRFGRIVNFATVAVPLRIEGESIYAASKAAVVSLTAILARELGDFGITVNAVGPSPIETDLIRAVPKDRLDRLLAQQAVHRFGTFEDVANVVDFFLRKESGFVTGQTLYLGGV